MTDDAPTEIGEQPPPPATAPSRPRRAWPVWRSVRNRYVAGVFGGIGERFDFDPFFLRIAAVAAAVLTRDEVPFVVPLAYSAWWLVVPEFGKRPLVVEAFRGRQVSQAVGAVLLGVLGGMLQVMPGLWFAALLAMAAWLLLAPVDDAPEWPRPPKPRSEEPGGAGSEPTDESGPRPDPPYPPHGATSPESADWDVAGAEGAQVSAAGNPAWRASWGRARRGVSQPLSEVGLRRRRAPRREPALWPLTLALLTVWAVVCLTLDRTTQPGLNPAIAVNGSLLIIGGVLILSAWRGRAGWTVLLGLGLIPAWIGFSASDIGRFPGRGSEVVTIFQPPADPITVTHGYGSTTVEVSPQAVESADPVEVDVSLTAGVATVEVPFTSRVELRVKGGFAFHPGGLVMGETSTHVFSPDPWFSGVCDVVDVVGADGSMEPPPLVETAPIVINATVGLGAIDVYPTC